MNPATRRRRRDLLTILGVSIPPAVQAVLNKATSFYSAKNATALLIPDTAPNGHGGNAQFGSTAGSDTNDPVWNEHTGEHYVYLPGTADNSISTPRPYATTHFTITYTDDTTETGTTTADPVVIGGTTHSGKVKTVVLRETNDAGAVGATADPNADIDTSSDTDAGQVSWVSGSGETWTVNRSTTGLATAVVTRSVILFDGVDDYLQLLTADRPTTTATTGKFTALQVWRTNKPNVNARTWASEPVNSRGISAYTPGDTSWTVKSGGATAFGLSTVSVTNTDSVLKGYGIQQDEGTARSWANGTFGPDVDTTGNGAPSFTDPRSMSRTDIIGNTQRCELVAIAIFDGHALTDEELTTLSDYIAEGGL